MSIGIIFVPPCNQKSQKLFDIILILADIKNLARINRKFTTSEFAVYSKTMWTTAFLTLENVVPHLILHVMVLLKLEKNLTGENHRRWYSPPVTFTAGDV